MSFLNDVLNISMNWTQKTLQPLGAPGLFILAFIESSFFPIPPDILLIFLSLAEPSKALFYAFICTAGSVLGGLFGYLIGYVGEKAILERFFDHKKIERIHNLYNKYEGWAVFIAGLTPIPYKLATISGGVFYINIKKFIIASVLSRGLRYFTISILIMIYGQKILDLLRNYFDMISIAAVIIAIMAFLIYKKLKKSTGLSP